MSSGDHCHLMSATKIPALRLQSHGLDTLRFFEPASVVAHLGAVQAQDFNMAQWAVGIRMRGGNASAVVESFNNGDFLRTHILRPTWHFVARDNIRWMLALSADRIRTLLRNAGKRRGIAEGLYAQTGTLLSAALKGGNHLTGKQIATLFEEEGIQTSDYWLYLFLMRAEADSLICSGRMHEGLHTYALLDERIPPAAEFPRRDAIAQLARIYLQSHSPATAQDFSWWSGLSVREARGGLDAAADSALRFEIAGQIYYTLADEPNEPNESSDRPDQVHLLPAFDEYIIAYRDRSAVITTEYIPRVLTTNGIFRPAIIKNGKVIGLWRKGASKASKKGAIELEYFKPASRRTEAQTAKAAARGSVFNEPAEMSSFLECEHLFDR
jgi:hypothetical protein